MTPVERSQRVLISGHNNAKIGNTIERGPWVGMPIYTLTLEERATCPRTCELWRACYGNGMPAAPRRAHGPALIDRLDEELRYYARTCGDDGFALRLHILGDFWSAEYVAAWARWMLALPGLHVWGYTHWPIESEIGDLLAALNEGWPDRWVIRFSVPPDAAPRAGQVTTIWRQPDPGPRVPEGLLCPQQHDKTATCGTCGLCWAPATRSERIVFVGHGMRKRSNTSRAALAPIAGS